MSKLNIDDDLVSSIVDPAQDPNAPDVFYRVISSSGASINSLLQRIQVCSPGTTHSQGRIQTPQELSCMIVNDWLLQDDVSKKT